MGIRALTGTPLTTSKNTFEGAAIVLLKGLTLKSQDWQAFKNQELRKEGLLVQ